MAEDVKVNLPTTVPPLQQLTLTTFQNGVITLINESNLPATALKEATNIFLYEKGAPGPRWGVNWYGNALPNAAAIDGGFMYQSASIANHIVAIGGGVVYRSLDNGVTWDTCTGGSFTSGKKCYAEQGSTSSIGSNYMYLTNGYDYPLRYDGTTTLQTFVAISPPSGLAAVPTGLTSNTNFAFFYRVSAVNAVGVTQATTSVEVDVENIREAWDPTNTGSSYVTLTWSAVTGAVRYDIYVCDNNTDDAANNLSYLASVGATATPAYVDNGQAAPNPNSTVPIQNTTGAPRVRELTSVGSRLFGVQDRDFPYRVWFTGSGPYVGYFADAYDGGYIDLQRGSQFYPVKVEDYRDGKGTPLATVWCDSADSRGCVWQIALTTATVLNTQYTQPSANKLPGSRGTSAPNSVVNVLDDYMYFNYQAVYNLGSRQSLFNLLSTDESSANVRQSLVQNISPANVPEIAGYYYLAKLFISYPKNSDLNSATMLYDTERKAYIPDAYDFGMERLFQFSDTNRANHLLFWKPGDTQFSETASSILGDYGQPFNTSLTTGLMPTQPKNRFEWTFEQTGYLEFANPVGGVRVELLGTDRINGFASQKTVNVVPPTTSSTVGWSTGAWSAFVWTDTTAAPTVYSESSTKRYFIVNKELNNYQWHVTTAALESQYILRTLQLEGEPTNAGPPGQWRLAVS